MDDQLITPADLGDMLHKPQTTLRQWRHRGIGPRSVRLEGGSVRYRTCDVRSWLNAQFEGE